MIGTTQLVLAVTVIAGCGHPSVAPAARTRVASADRVALGELTIDISTSRTAAVFHAVDQLSRWSEFTHPQYASWAPEPRDAEAEALLRRHAILRRAHGWGSGMEATFYAPSGGLDDACDEAVRTGVLSRAEADDERAILRAWDARLDGALARAADAPRHLRVELERHAEAFGQLARAWLAIADLPVPADAIRVALVPSPGRGSGGGGANGGVLVIEVPSEGDTQATLTTFGHELVHLLLAPRRDEMARAAARCALDVTTMGEAIAYAMAPGLFAYGTSVGALEAQAQRYAKDTPTSSYARFARLAVAIKPAVADALAHANAGMRGHLPSLYDAVCRAN